MVVQDDFEELVRLHYGAKVKVKIGEVDSEIDSTIGVRQGSCEGPVLFLFIMQAAMETLEWPEGKAGVYDARVREDNG